MTDATLCFIDTETTGVHPGRQVWEIGMIRRTPGGPDSEFQFFVDVDLSDADPFGLRVGRFYDRHPMGKVTAHGGVVLSKDLRSPAEAAELVAHWTHGAHLVGAVPNFDAETLAPLLREHGFLPGWHYHLVDVEALAVGFLAGQGWGTCTCGAYAEGRVGHANDADCRLFRPGIRPPWRSDDLTEALGLPPVMPDERHTALGDARWARDIYDAVMNSGPTRPVDGA